MVRRTPSPDVVVSSRSTSRIAPRPANGNGRPWRCRTCGALLGIERGNELHVRLKDAECRSLAAAVRRADGAGRATQSPSPLARRVRENHRLHPEPRQHRSIVTIPLTGPRASATRTWRPTGRRAPCSTRSRSPSRLDPEARRRLLRVVVPRVPARPACRVVRARLPRPRADAAEPAYRRASPRRRRRPGAAHGVRRSPRPPAGRPPRRADLSSHDAAARARPGAVRLGRRRTTRGGAESRRGPACAPSPHEDPPQFVHFLAREVGELLVEVRRRRRRTRARGRRDAGRPGRAPVDRGPDLGVPAEAPPPGGGVRCSASCHGGRRDLREDRRGLAAPLPPAGRLAGVRCDPARTSVEAQSETRRLLRAFRAFLRARRVDFRAALHARSHARRVLPADGNRPVCRRRGGRGAGPAGPAGSCRAGWARRAWSSSTTRNTTRPRRDIEPARAATGRARTPVGAGEEPCRIPSGRARIPGRFRRNSAAQSQSQSQSQNQEEIPVAAPGDPVPGSAVGRASGARRVLRGRVRAPEGREAGRSAPEGGAGAKKLLQGRTLAEAKAIVDRALADPWWLTGTRTSAAIAGKSTRSSGARRPAARRGSRGGRGASPPLAAAPSGSSLAQPRRRATAARGEPRDPSRDNATIPLAFRWATLGGPRAATTRRSRAEPSPRRRPPCRPRASCSWGRAAAARRRSRARCCARGRRGIRAAAPSSCRRGSSASRGRSMASVSGEAPEVERAFTAGPLRPRRPRQRAQHGDERGPGRHLRASPGGSTDVGHDLDDRRSSHAALRRRHRAATLRAGRVTVIACGEES